MQTFFFAFIRSAALSGVAGLLILGLACGDVFAAAAGTATGTQATQAPAITPVPAAKAATPAKPAASGQKKAGTTKKAPAKAASSRKKAAAKPAARSTAKPKAASAKATGKATGKTAGKGSGKTAAKPKTEPAKAAAVPAASVAKPAAAVEAPKFPASKVVPLSPKGADKLPVAETWMPLVRRLNKDGIEMAYLRQMFGRMGDAYSHEPMGTKVKELFGYKYVAKPPRKATGKPSATPPVYKSMVKPESIDKCKVYLTEHEAVFTRMEETYGVPREVVVGLLMVETRLGTYLGYNSSFWSLACMAAADEPGRVDATVRTLPLPMDPDKDAWLQKILKERSTWAYKELLALVRFSQANGLDPLAMPGSVYGAVGICQFMPSNLPKFGVDGNKDGTIDLFDPADAIPSVANYLKEHGWSGKDWKEKDRSGHHATLKRYNKSNVYANTILAIADGIVAPPETALADASAKAPAAAPAVKSKTDATVKAPAKKAAPTAKPAAKPGTKKPSAAGKTTSKAPASKKGGKAASSKKSPSGTQAKKPAAPGQATPAVPAATEGPGDKAPAASPSASPAASAPGGTAG